jgi:DNA replication protein DnaC
MPASVHTCRGPPTPHNRQRNINRLMLRTTLIDDWGLEPLKPAQRNDLMEIMDDRHGLTSTAMVSQLPTDQWYASIGDNTLADAILDRLMHNAHRLQLKGESMRKIMGQLTDGEHLR